MNIIGNGFIARNLQPLKDMHPGVTVLAAGVPRQDLPQSEHIREVKLVHDTILRCRANGQLLVFFSTTSMYGASGCSGREDQPVIASTSYGQHKLNLEALIRDSEVDYLILRLTQVIGPREPNFRLLPSLIDQLVTGHIRIYRDARRDLLYIADFIAVLNKLLDTKPRNEIVNIASGDCVPVLRIVDYLEKRLGVTAERQIIPAGLAYCSSVAKLHAAVPEVAQMEFSPGYFKRAIDWYLTDARPAHPV
jgi:nucleoside-diphosphate-sugar epimerase